MKKTLALFSLVALCSMAWAKTYIVYDLAATDDSTRVTTLNEAPSDINGGYFDSKMLFVSDDTEYYMGVFEVTEAQAHRLFSDITNTSSAQTAYTAPEKTTFPLRSQKYPNLFLPTVEQWQQYAEGTRVTFSNVYGGSANGGFITSVKQWRPTSTESNYVANEHGVYDIFGNVAEYTIDKQQYYGGSACGVNCKFKDLTIDTAWDTTATDELGDSLNSFRGVRLVYTPPAAQTYTVSIKLNGVEVYTETAVPGDNVSFEIEAEAGYELLPEPTAVSPEELTVEGMNFVMPESNVTIEYTAKKFVTVAVVDGKTSATRALEGESLTVTATLPEPPYCFTEWTLPEGWTGSVTEKSMTVTVPETVVAGSEVSFTANYKTYPRVLVYGGTVTPAAASGVSLGEGYYPPGTMLDISAYEVSGLSIVGWQVSTQTDPIKEAHKIITVGDYDTEVTYTALYEKNGAEPPANDKVVVIGQAPAGNTAPFGYTAEAKVPYTSGGNTFEYYGAKQVDGEYATLDLVNHTITYGSSASNNTTNKTANLVLKRTVLDGMAPYYIAIYETTKAQVEYLRELKEGEQRNGTLTASAMPYDDRGTSKATETFERIQTLFKAYNVAPQLPTKAQIEGIKKARLLTNADGSIETYTGSGYWNGTYGDKRITDEMIHADRSNAALEVGTKTVDPYGFYDLWGNHAERLYGESKVWGGYFNNAIGNCNLAIGQGETGVPTSFRTAIEMLPQVEVTIAGVNLNEENVPQPLKVIQGEKLLLHPQVQSDKLFAGWTAKTATGEVALTADETGAYPYTVTEAVTLTPNFTDAATEITVEYAGCLGPATVLPGQTSSLYLDATKTFAELVADPAEAVSIDSTEDGAVVVTFKAPAVSNTIKLTATYTEAPAAPGYLFRIK